MKKIINKTFKKTTAYLLTIIVAFSSLFSINTFAYNTESGEIRYNENCATYYFTELIDGFGTNSEGTCSFVASAMLLSYYDSFWNDAIISDGYEENGSWMYTFWGYRVMESPGIKKEPRWVNNDTYSTYGEYIDAFADEYLHLELIRMAKDDLNYYYSDLAEGLMDLFGNFKVFDRYFYSSVDWSISIPQARDLLEHYLEEREIGSNKITVNCLSFRDVMEDLSDELSEEEKADAADEEIRQQVINKVNNGIPVVYAGFEQDSSGNWSGHALVAYDYDSTNDELIFHSGWNNNTDRILKEGDSAFNYGKNLYMMWFDINDTNYPHNICSYNYNLTIGQNQLPTCMCNFSSHPEHRHSPLNGYGTYDSNGHNVSCRWCERTFYESHTYSYTLYSASQHKASCNCGYEIVNNHVVAIDSTTGLSSCIYCGAFVGSPSLINNILPYKLNRIILNESGSYVDDNGIVYLSESDAKMVLSGQITVEEILINKKAHQ